MKSEVIFTGTELLLGQILNTNAQYLQQTLASIGIDLYYQITVGDNLYRLTKAIKQAGERADLIFICGGLGPTEDDLSREALAASLQIPLQENQEALEIVKHFFNLRGFKMSSNNLKQALVPQGGSPINNPVGTAPGIILNHSQKMYILLPGPPGEFKRMVQKEIIPLLQKKFDEHLMVIRSKILKLAGIGEGTLDESLGELLHSINPSLAPTAKLSQVHLRITAKAKDNKTADKMIDQIEEQVREKLNDYIFGENDTTLADAVTELLKRKKYRLAIVEAFTGGHIADLLTNTKDGKIFLKLSLSIFEDKWLIKILNINSKFIKLKNAEKATKLAEEIKKYCEADVGLAIINSETEDKIYIAIAFQNNLQLKEYLLWGSVKEIKERAANTALLNLWQMLKAVN